MAANSRTPVALCLEYPLGLQGGVSILVAELARGLSDGFAITLVSPDSDAAALPDDLRDRLAGHVRFDPESAPAGTLAGALRERGVRLAHFHWGGNYTWRAKRPGRSPILAVRRAGIRCLSTIHSVVTPYFGLCDPGRPAWQKRLLLLAAWVGRMQVLARSEAELAVSRHDATLLRRWYAPLAGRISHLYHSRIDERRAEPPPPDEARRDCVLAVGHIAFRKGQHLLAEAFARVAPHHPGWSLHLLGDILETACAETIRQTAAAAGVADRVHLEGPVPGAAARMRDARVFVQPSLQEALGLALQEALFEGCACIGTRAGGIPELIEPGTNGLLVDLGDTGGLAATLDRLMGDPALRRTLGGAGRPSILRREMTRERMIRKHREIYRSLAPRD